MKQIKILVAAVLAIGAIGWSGNMGKAASFKLTAKSGCGFVTLSWDAVSDVKGYFIYRGKGSGNELAEPITDFPIKETTYKDETEIEKDTQYCYIVKAVGQDLKVFASSNEACAKSICPQDCTLELKFKLGSKTFWKNGVAQPEMSSAPISKWNRTFLLIRYVAEVIGAKVDWDALTKVVTITTKDGNIIKLTVGKNKGYVNGKETQIDGNNSQVTPIIVDGRTLCPLRFTGFNLGATGPDDILWDPDTQMAILKFKNPDCSDEGNGGGTSEGGGSSGEGGSGGGSEGSGGSGGSGSSGSSPDIVKDDGQVLPGSSKTSSGSYSDPKGNPEKTWGCSSGLGNSWIAVQGGGGEFNKHVTFSGGGMYINAPEGSSWAKSGVRSKEPYFVVPSNANESYSILFDIDSQKTNGFVVALSDYASTIDPWNATNVWINFNQSPNGAQALFGMANLVNDKDTRKSLNDIDNLAPAKMLVTIKGTSVCVNTSYGYSLSGNYSWLKPGTKVYLYIISSSIDGGGQPVKFGLKSVKGYKAGGCVSGTYTPPYNNLVYSEEFDSMNSTMWSQLETAGGFFKEMAKFEGGAFNTACKKNNSWGKTGLKSKYYFLEVTKEMESLPYTILLDMDPGKTGGFVFAITTVNSSQDPWNVENVWTSFIRHEYGVTSEFYMGNSGDAKETRVSNDTLPPNLPSKIAMTICPGKVKVVTSLGFSATGNYAWLKPGTKLFFYIFNHPYSENMPSSMSVKGVRIYRHQGAKAEAWNPQMNLTRFVEDFQSGNRDGMWQKIETAGGSFKNFAKFETGAFTVNVPAGNSWGKTGIKSEHFFLPVTETMSKYPTVIQFELDSARSKGFRLALTNNNSSQDPWNVPCLWTGFSIDAKANKGTYYFQDNPAANTIYKDAKDLSPTPPSWVKITVKPGYMKVETSLGQSFDGNFAWLKAGTQLYLYAFTHPYIDGQASSMCIKKILVAR